MNYRSPKDILNWSTDAVPVAQRLDYFAAALSSALTPMRVASAGHSGFCSTIEMADLGPVMCIHQTGTAHRSFREKADIARSSGRTFHLILNLGAPWNLDHCGRIRLGRGDAVLTDSVYGHRIDIGGQYDVMNLRLSEAWVRHWLGDLPTSTGRRLPRTSMRTRLLTSYVAQLSPGFVVRAPVPSTVIGDHLGALLALAYADLNEKAAPKAVGDAALFDQIKDVIAQRCGEPKLDANAVATALGVLPLELHRRLAADGETFAALLLANRVAVARRILSSPLFAKVPVHEIARRAGFPNAKLFNRLLGPSIRQKGLH